MEHEKLILDSCLMDDEYMARYFTDNRKCTAYVLNTLLPYKDLEVVDVQVHHSIPNLENRDVILDIYASDRTGKIYDIEIQRDSREAYPKRARYYSSLIDANISDPGSKFKDLVETWVIFILDDDFFKQGLPLYTIDRTVNETGQKFEDEAHIMYVNGKYRGDDAIGKLIHDFFCSRPEDMLCPILAEQAYIYKKTEGGMKIMSEYVANIIEERYGDIIRKAREEARKEALKEAREEARKEALKEAREEARKEAEEKVRKLEQELEETKRREKLIEELDDEKKKMVDEYVEQLRK